MWLTLTGRKCRWCSDKPAWVGMTTRRLFCHVHAVRALDLELCRPISEQDSA